MAGHHYNSAGPNGMEFPLPGSDPPGCGGMLHFHGEAGASPLHGSVLNMMISWLLDSSGWLIVTRMLGFIIRIINFLP